jgi:uncharacterized protein (TIGR02231 family)
MKITLILLLILPTIIFGQTEKHIIKAPIEEVKLYITAGQMVHRHKLELKKGRNRLVFAGISAYADPQSIQFIMAGDYKLVSVTTEMDYLAAEQVNPRIGKLKDSLEMLEDKLQLNKDQLDSYYAEEAVLNSNRDLGGSNQSLTMDQIKEAADFYRERTLSVKRSISGLRKEQREHNDQIELTRYQLVELNYNENLRSNQIVVLLDVDKNESRSVVLKYLVTDCGWAATYDLSAKDINQKVNLKYKAQVYNNTGNEWKDVKLTLSTGDPRLSASIPDLKTWYLNHYTIQNLKGRKQKYYAPTANDEEYRGMIETNLNSANQRVYDNYYLASEVNQSNLRLDNKFKLQEQMNVGSKAVQMKQIQISELTTEFDIKLKFHLMLALIWLMLKKSI